MNHRKSGKTGKKSSGLLLFGFFLLLVLLWEPVQAEEQENQAGKALLCPEDEIVLINIRSRIAQVFDSTGKDCGLMEYYFEYNSAVMESKKGIYKDSGPEGLLIRNGFQGPVLRAFPNQDISCQISGDYCLVSDEETAFLELLHCTGKVLYTSRDPLLIKNYCFEIQEMGEGVVLFCYSSEGVTPPSESVTLFSADGTVSKKMVENTEICEDLMKNRHFLMNFGIFGNALVTGNPGSYRCYSWKCLNGEEEYLPLSALVRMQGRGRIDNIVLAVGLPDEDGICKVYDTDLSVTGTLSYGLAEDLPSFGFCGGLWRGGFFQGNEYEELEGKRCDGAILWGFWDETAVARDGNLVRIASPEGCIHVTVGENESVTAANRNYAVIRGDEMDENHESDFRVVHLPKEKEIWSGHCRGWNRLFSEDGPSLNDNSCMIMTRERDFERKIQVFNAEGDLTCVIRRSSAMIWLNDLIFLCRGPYVGFADLNGEWVCRTTKERM